jgi:hypothetical protein
VKRPAGITIAALLLLANGAALALQIAMLYARPAIGESITRGYLGQLFPLDKTDASGMMIVSGIGAIFCLAVGGGLWFLRDTARWGLILATGLPLLQHLAGAAAALSTKSSGLGDFGDAFWFQTIAEGVIVWYLFQPHVRCAFAGPHEFYDAYQDMDKERNR